MNCSGCGSEIPVFGKVCPHCLRDKSSDRIAHVAMSAGGLAGLALGEWHGGLWWVLGCAVLGVVIASGILSALGFQDTTKRAPLVATNASIAGAVAASTADDFGKKLSALEAARKGGLVSETEYSTAKARILSSL